MQCNSLIPAGVADWGPLQSLVLVLGSTAWLGVGITKLNVVGMEQWYRVRARGTSRLQGLELQTMVREDGPHKALLPSSHSRQCRCAFQELSCLLIFSHQRLNMASRIADPIPACLFPTIYHSKDGSFSLIYEMRRVDTNKIWEILYVTS